MGAAPQTAGEAAGLRPRGGPGVPRDLGSQPGGLPGATGARLLRRRERDRHLVLRDGPRGGPDPERSAPARSRAGGAPRDLRQLRRGPRAPAPGRLRGPRPRRLRQARQLLLAADPPLDEAVPRRRTRDAHSRDGAAHRVAPGERAGRRLHEHRARRLLAQQRDPAPERAEGGGCPRLGALDHRAPSRGPHLSPVPAAQPHGQDAHDERRRAEGARDSHRGRVRRRVLRRHRARRRAAARVLPGLPALPHGRDPPGHRRPREGGNGRWRGRGRACPGRAGPRRGGAGPRGQARRRTPPRRGDVPAERARLANRSEFGAFSFGRNVPLSLRRRCARRGGRRDGACRSCRCR